jgi:hypothetical protein
MNPGHREGWPPAQPGASGPSQQQTEQAQGQGPRLPGLFGYVVMSLPCSRDKQRRWSLERLLFSSITSILLAQC